MSRQRERCRIEMMETLRCRVKSHHWWLAFVCVPAGAFFFYAPFQVAQEPPQPLWPLFLLFGLMALFFWLGAIYGALSLVREEIIAEETGLRWRGALGPWKNAKWEEISDFYLSGKPTRISPVQTSPKFTIPTVETPRGKLKLERSFTNLGEITAVIAARATNSQARDWEIFELRDAQNFSQKFGYWTKSEMWAAPVMTLGAFYVLGFLGWNMAFPPPYAMSQRYPLSWSPDLLSILMIVVKLGPIALIMVVSPWMMWHQRQSALQHRDEQLEVSMGGLAWQNGEKRIEASWEEVRAVRRLPRRGFKHDYFVETQNGDFTVWSELRGLTLWLSFARHFAPHIAPQENFPEADIGGETSTWSSEKIGEGARIFHFQTRETRAMLWFATFHAPIFFLLPLVMRAMRTSDDEALPMPWKLYIALSAVIVALCYVWFCFKRAAIWADETGLEWRFPLWKTRRLKWSEIEGFGHDESGFFIRTDDKKRKLWQISAPVRQAELLQLIAERAENATGKWDSI